MCFLHALFDPSIQQHDVCVYEVVTHIFEVDKQTAKHTEKPRIFHQT